MGNATVLGEARSIARRANLGKGADVPARSVYSIAATAAIALASILAPGNALATTTSPIRFDMTIYGPCVQGWAVGAVTSVVWRDAGGELKAAGVPEYQSEGGFWEFCPADQTVVPGDRITVSDGSYTRKYVVPDLTLVIDRVHNIAYGTGPAGRTIHLCGSFSFYWAYGDCWSLRADQDGKWTFDPHRDLYGGMEANLTWTSPNGDRLFLQAFPPELGVTLGESTFSGWASPLTAVQVSLDNGRVFTSSAATNRNGSFSGAFMDSGGNPISVSPGDHVHAPSLAADADWIVPEIEGSANRVTDVVRGSCSDTGTSMHDVRVSVVRPDGHVRGSQFLSIRSDGTFRASFRNYFGGGDIPVSANMRLGDQIRIDCLQTTGDWARLSFVVG